MKHLLLAFAVPILAACLLAGCGPQRSESEVYIALEDARKIARDRVYPATVRIDARRSEYVGGERRRLGGTGSGVIFDAEGHVLTNYHVAGRAEELTCILYSKERIRAKLIGGDAWTDLAVIQLDMDEITRKGAAFSPGTFGDSDKVQEGDSVLAVGSPFGMSRSISNGIISCHDRILGTGLQLTGGLETGLFNTWLQTDAAINPGNSGGALVNLRGELIGINTAIVSRTGGYEGIGLAIPANMANFVMDSLIKKGKVIRGWLGVMIQDVTPELAQAFGIEKNEGALISEVYADTPAQAAGLKNGDVVIQYNGQDVKNSSQLKNTVASTAPGTEVKLVIVREKKKIELKVKVGERPEKIGEAQKQTPSEEGAPQGESFFGLYLRDISPREREMFEIDPHIVGVVIVDVDQSSEAAEKGLRPGDVITEVNKNKIKNMAEFKKAVDEGKGKPYLFLINHGGQGTSYVVLGK